MTGAPYARVPEWLLDHADVSDRGVRLFAVLARYIDGDDRCWPSRGKLARRMRISPKTIDRGLSELANVGAVTITRRWTDKGEPTSSLYVLHFERSVASNLTPPVETDLTPPRARDDATRGDRSDALTRATLNERTPNPLPASDASARCGEGYLLAVDGSCCTKHRDEIIIGDDTMRDVG